MISEFWEYFHCACIETAIQELPVKNLTPPFAQATQISYKTCITTTEWRLRLWFLELVLASIFRALFGLTEGPHIALFKRFQTSWPYHGQTLSFNLRWWIYVKLVLERSHPREDYKELNESLPNFSGWCRSCRSFLSSTRSISSGTMDGQSNLHSEVVLVPTPVQFDKQIEKQCEGVSLFVRLVYVLFCHEAPLSIKMPLSNMQLLELLTNYTEQL